MRPLVASVAFVILAGFATAADDKIDAKKLVGKWESVADEKQPKVTVEYTADGKVTGRIQLESMELAVAGTYTVEGDKLTQKTKIDGRDLTVIITIKKLNDSELTGEWDGGKQSFRRAEKK